MFAAGPSADSRPPCVLHEDEHLLVVNKPAGWNTHSPSPFAGEGIYDWLKHREPRWSDLAIIHRLDKETSGVMVFGKSTIANRSLTGQFAARAVRKKYLLLTDRPVRGNEFTLRTTLVRTGDKYASRPLHVGGDVAETRFRVLKMDAAGRTILEAEPLTGRTHQIRVHAADSRFPIIGDLLYGGVASPRICLHSAELSFDHPASGSNVRFRAPARFEAPARLALREAIIEPRATDAFRLIHGAGDGPQHEGWYVDRLGGYLLSGIAGELGNLADTLGVWREELELQGIYQKMLSRDVRRARADQSPPQLMAGGPAPERFTIRENGVTFELSFHEGGSVGLFLDQRDNRRRLLHGHVAAGFGPLASEVHNPKPEVLNTFAYTCGFSVSAALAGWRTTSLDLSRKYLEWGRRNFVHNGLDPAMHDFIHGDTFDWLRRLAKKARLFDVVILDPPTFSQSKQHGVFRAEKDYAELVAAALPVLQPGGVLLASTNAAGLAPEDFLAHIEGAVRSAKRKIVQQHYVPQPPDFPISRAEPAYLKTVWLRVS